MNTYGINPIKLLTKINKKILKKISVVPLYDINIDISIFSVLTILLNNHEILLIKNQYLYGNNIRKINVLNQFIEKTPVQGSNTENKFIIIFKLFFG